MRQLYTQQLHHLQTISCARIKGTTDKVNPIWEPQVGSCGQPCTLGIHGWQASSLHFLGGEEWDSSLHFLGLWCA